MATPTETPARGAGFGAKRFLVRGVDFTSEEALGIIRPRITDYPERVPLISGFPLAGRRGGSRPRPQVLAEGETAPEPPGLYPVERKRDVLGLTGALAGLTVAQQKALLGPRGPGFPRTHRLEVATTVTSVIASVPLPGPALITRIEVQGNITAVTPFVDIGFKYSTDDDTSGGFATTGARFFLAGAGVFDYNLGLERGVWTPNVLVPHSRWFFKMIVRNNQAGTIVVINSYTCEWL